MTDTTEAPKSWKPELDDGSGFASNALRFATKEEAEKEAKSVFGRWLAATDWRVSPSEDSVNAVWDDTLGRSVTTVP